METRRNKTLERLEELKPFSVFARFSFSLSGASPLPKPSPKQVIIA
jgi:hypothetical protein